MRKTPLQKLLLHFANIAVIIFILLPMAAVVIGSLLAEKNLAGDTRSIIPGDITFDNFRVIISRGEQRGQIFEQATYLPDMKLVHYGGHAAKKSWAHVRMFGAGAIRFFNKHGWKLV